MVLTTYRSAESHNNKTLYTKPSIYKKRTISTPLASQDVVFIFITFYEMDVISCIDTGLAFVHGSIVYLFIFEITPRRGMISHNESMD